MNRFNFLMKEKEKKEKGERRKEKGDEKGSQLATEEDGYLHLRMRMRISTYS